MSKNSRGSLHGVKALPGGELRSGKGFVLFTVIFTLIVISLLAVVILGMISNQTRHTHHRVSRVGATYAAEAGMVLAYENLRTGAWSMGLTYCINSSTAGCTALPASQKVTDPLIPFEVMIDIGARLGAGQFWGCAPIQITVNYLYS